MTESELRDKNDQLIEHPFRVGDFVYEILVTDSVVYEVVGITAKSVVLRTTRDIPNILRSGWPYVNTAVESNPEGLTFTRRLRKDGTIKMASYSRPLRLSKPHQVPEGTFHFRYTDYTY